MHTMEMSRGTDSPAPTAAWSAPAAAITFDTTTAVGRGSAQGVCDISAAPLWAVSSVAETAVAASPRASIVVRYASARRRVAFKLLGPPGARCGGGPSNQMIEREVDGEVVVEDDSTTIVRARSVVVMASAAALIASPVDGVTTALRDEDTLTADVRYARRLGMTGKLCIHPSQLHPVHAALAPSAAELDWARRILDAAGPDGSATAVDGQMIDAPVVERARRILARAQSR
jgi:C-C_Bond_Lyase of the TIM-Barrel fold